MLLSLYDLQYAGPAPGHPDHPDPASGSEALEELREVAEAGGWSGCARPGQELVAVVHIPPNVHSQENDGKILKTNMATCGKL